MRQQSITDFLDKFVWSLKADTFSVEMYSIQPSLKIPQGIYCTQLTKSFNVDS